MNIPHTTPKDPLEAPSGTEEIKRFAAELYRRRILIASIMLATIALTAFYLVRQPKQYLASTVLEYDPTPPRPLGSEVEGIDDGAEAFWLSQEFYETQNRILKSVNVAERTVRRLGLNSDLGFLYGPRPPAGSAPVSVAQAASILRGRLTVESVRSTRLVEVRYEDTDAARAARITNALVASYLEKTIEDRTTTTIDALDWLQNQLGSVRAQLEGSELALHDFKAENNILSVSLEDRQNMVTNQLEGLTAALTETRRERIAMNARVNAIRSADGVAPEVAHSAAIDSNSAVLALRTKYREREAICQALSTRYGSEHPELLGCRSELETIRAALDSEVQGILTTAESSLREIQEVERGVRSALDEVNRSGLELNLREIEYQRLLREKETNAHLFGVLLDRTAATNVTRFHRIAFARVVDEATPPSRPSRPRKGLGMALGAMGGLGLGILAALLIRLFDRTISSTEDLAALGLHIVGVIPKVDSATARARAQASSARRRRKTNEPPPNIGLEVLTNPRSSFAEAYRLVRTNLAFVGSNKKVRSILVASAAQGDGKTTIAINLCATLARNQLKVLLVDTDLRRPNVHRSLGLPNGPGVSTILIGEATVDECVVRTDVEGFDVLTCGPIPPNPSELLDDDAFTRLLERAISKYDRVILDSPPVGVVSDAMILASATDATVLVARPRSTPRDQLVQGLKQLRTVGANVAGVIVNAVSEGDLTFGGSAYYYGRSEYSDAATNSNQASQASDADKRSAR